MNRSPSTHIDRDAVTPAEEDQLIRFLLGELDQREQAEVEDRYFADTSRFERLLAVEDDLVDAYVRGELPRARAQALEHRASRVASLRRKIQIARGLQSYVEEHGPAKHLFSHTFWWRPAVWSAAALLMLAVTLTMWWFRAGPSRQAAPQHAESQPSGETREQRPLAPPPTPQKPDVIVAFALTASSVRAPGESNTLQFPADASLVRLRLEHEGAGYRRYRVVIQTVEGRDVWRRQDLEPARSGTASVVVDVPASRLPADDYILTLSGVSRGSFEEAASFSFRVKREQR
jgi:hypothetical protein